MSENVQDIERRKRLHEFFRQDTQIWQDIAAEINISLYNEVVRLKSRKQEGREWSAGYVCGQEYILDMERFFKKQWNSPTMQGQVESTKSL